jgi:hypothetical protein
MDADNETQRLTAVSNSDEDGEFFRTGETDTTWVGPLVAGILAVLLAAGCAMNLIGLARTGFGGPSFIPVYDTEGPAWELHGIAALVASVVFLALAVGLGIVAAASICSRRNSAVIVNTEGIIRQSWRRRRTMIPWDRVKRLVVTHNETGRFLLTAQYLWSV